MVVLTIPKHQLDALVGQKLAIEQLERALFDFGMELASHDEEAGTVTVELTAERIDLVSPQGLARALSAYLGIKTGMPKWQVKKSGVAVKVGKHLEARSRSVAAIVRGLKLTDELLFEIIALQEKIHETYARKRKKGAIGVYPLEHCTPPFTYAGEKPGEIRFVPLGESREMTGAEILEEHPKGREYAHLLAGAKHYPVWRDAKGEVMSVPPIINSAKTGKVTAATTDVFIEVSGPRIGPLKEILNVLVTAFADMGGKIESVTMQYDDLGSFESPDLSAVRRDVSLRDISRLLGIAPSPAEIVTLLGRMLYDVVEQDEKHVVVEAPATRADLWHEVDVIDDIARAYGFNAIPATFPNVSTVARTLPFSDLREKASELLVGAGLLESWTFALTNEETQYGRMSAPAHDPVRLANSADSGTNMVRTWLLPELLKSLAHNRSKTYPQRLFECGFVVVSDSREDVRSRNELHLAVVIAENGVTFTHARQALDSVLGPLGFEAQIKPVTHPSFLAGRAGDVFVNGEKLGTIGEISPAVLSAWGLLVPVAAFEIVLEKLL